VNVRRVRAEDWEALRDVRLRALATPDAFGTVHADAVGRAETWWREWAARSADGAAQAMFFVPTGQTGPLRPGSPLAVHELRLAR